MWDEPMESSPGQKFLASLVDIAFFVVLGLMGWHGVLKEGAVLMLLGLYAQGRFNVAMQKQQSVQMASVASGGGGPLPPGGSGRFQSVPVTPTRTEESMPAAVPGAATRRMPPVPRTLLDMAFAYAKQPAYVLLALSVLAMLFTGGKLP